MTLRYPLTILQDILYLSLLGLLHIIFLSQIVCRHHCLSVFLYLTQNHQPCEPLYHSCCIPRWSGDLFQSYCSFCFRFCFPNSLTLFGHNCHTCCIHSWINCCSCFSIYFLLSLMLETYLLVLIFLLCFFRSALSSRTNIFPSSDI